jgi:multidrug efflux system outer membrane protein
MSWRSALRPSVALLSAAALLVASCTLGPDYERPDVAPPETWRDMPAPESESLANTAWWELFADPALQEVVRVALEENEDYLIATERIEEFRARLGFTQADFYPQVDLNASTGQYDVSQNGPTPNFPNNDDNAHIHNVSLDVFWELDVFGRIRRASEAERALLYASEETRRAVAIALVADVGQAYVELRDLDRRVDIGRRTLASRAEYVDLARRRFEGGLTSEKDWRQAEAEYHRLAAILQDFERQDRQKENQLSQLIGRNPGPIVRAEDWTGPATSPQVPAGLPSELLERRPDLLAAEDILHAETADIGAAKALLFPRIALTGSTGYEATHVSDLFEGQSVAWSLAGNLLQPIFEGFRNTERVAIQESQMRQALYEYERSVHIAFREVEDALVAYQKTGEQRVSQAARVAAEREVLRLSDLRYRGGVSDYLEVLDAQRSLFSAEIDEVVAISDHYVALIRLYKALGGGWPTGTPAEAAVAGDPSATEPAPSVPAADGG